MPSARSFQDYFTGLRERVLQRGDAREAAAKALPPDFTGQVFNRARQEAGRIDERAAKLDVLIAEVELQLKAAERQVAATRPLIMSQPRRRGDVLGEFRVEPGQPTGAITTKETLAARTRLVTPLRRRLEALEREKWLLQQERGQLKRIAERAAAGDITLIHLLSDIWRGRLEIGPAIAGKLPKAARELWAGRNTIYVSSSGDVLPPEALDEEGKPDLPPAGRVPR